MDSNNNICDMPRYYRNNEKKLAKAQRKLRNKVIGSANYSKQQKKVNKIAVKVSNQRKDFLHKRSIEIANLYDFVAV